MFARDLVESVHVSESRLDLGLRLNWYRSLPLSCLEHLEIRVDQESLDPDDVDLELGELRCTVADALTTPGGDGPWWPVTESITLRAPIGPPVGARSEVSVILAIRIPYLIGPDGAAVVIRDRTTVRVRGLR